MSWQKDLSKLTEASVKLNEPLCRHTTWQVGGKAEALVEPKDRNDLCKIIKFSRVKKLPVFVIGAGSNLLVSDKGIKGIVLKLSKPFFKNIEFKRSFVIAGAGLSLNRLVNLTKDRGLSGCEFLAGIPGTLAGAIAMNAATRDICSENARFISIADLIKRVKVSDSYGNLRVLKNKDIRFGYRSSDLSKYIIISAQLKLKTCSKKAISNKIQKFISYKNNIQDLKSRSAGCVFKNPGNSHNPNLTAGKLIDAAGLKGKRIGNAQISGIHANFILNKGKARASDIMKLIRLAQARVKKEFNICLEPEVKMVGRF